jgi:hypothetical protein
MTPAMDGEARWRKQWSIERSRGLKRLTSPERAQIHVQALTAQNGFSIRSIADASGVAPAAISELNRGVCSGLKVVTEKLILAVTAEMILNRPNREGFVPNIGARRRLQALMVIGYRHSDLTPKLGFSSAVVLSQAGNWISQRKHDKVKDVYEQLWDTFGPAPLTSRVRVANSGYLPPLAWDDESIDDPNAVPENGDGTKKGDALVEDVDFLVRTGASAEEIGQRTGMAWTSIERQLHRYGRADLVAAAKNDQRDNARHARKAVTA